MEQQKLFEFLRAANVQINNEQSFVSNPRGGEGSENDGETSDESVVMEDEGSSDEEETADDPMEETVDDVE